MTQVIATSRAGWWQARLEATPPLAWLAFQAAALWIHWRWAAARVADGSDDPLGVVALAALIGFIIRSARGMRGHPRPLALALALGLSAAATATVFTAPPLAGALLAALALAAGLRAFMPSGRAIGPLAGLAVLALPCISSLQFYAGHPLRLVTAQLSTWGLQLAGIAAERSGTAMLVEGRLVIVDAPCSGVQMVWMAYFCACTMAALLDLSERRFFRALPWVGVLVLAGNTLRNSVLVMLEARQASVHYLLHEGVGLLVLALVCAGVVAIVRGGRDDHA
jgi:exosortase/archaeosortase family protein